jgi:hypothetical protein
VIVVSAIALSGAGAGVVVVAALVTRFTVLARIFLSYRQPTGSGRQGWAQRPGFGARTGPFGTSPGDAGPHGTQTRDRAAELRQRDQARAYWEPEQEEGTLPAAGFIGDTAEPGPGAGRDPG